MTTFFQLVVSGISVGSAYALVGIGLVLVFRTTNALNFAQGTYAVLAAMTTSVLAQHMPLPLAAVAAIVITGIFGTLMGLVALSGAEVTPLNSLIVTLGVALVAEAVELLVFGDAPKTYGAVAAHAWDVGGVLIQPQYALIVGVTLAATAGLAIVLRWTIVGNALVACADATPAARLIGLDVRVLGAVAFAVAGVLGAVAGILVAPITPLSYDADVSVAVNGFAAAAFGGLLSIPGALAGGLVLGIAEQLVVGYVNAQYELAIALVIMLILISWRTRAQEQTA